MANPTKQPSNPLIDIHERLYKEHQIQYVDPELLPLPSLLKGGLSNLQWARPIYTDRGAPWRLLDAATPFDAMQYTGLGDCIIASAFALLATTPKLLHRVFKGLGISMAGIYEINLFVDGEPRSIIIDDFIVSHYTNPEKRTPEKYRMLWPLLLQKAIIKLVGSLSLLDTHERQAKNLAMIPICTMLTSSPTTYIAIGSQSINQDDLWIDIVNHLHNEHIIQIAVDDIMSTPDDSKDRGSEFETHAFAMLECDVKHGQRVVLVYDTRNYYTPQELEDISFKELPDTKHSGNGGVYWIPWDRLLQAQPLFSITHAGTRWATASFKCSVQSQGTATIDVAAIMLAEQATVHFEAMIPLGSSQYTVKADFIAVINAETLRHIGCFCLHPRTTDPTGIVRDLPPGKYAIVRTGYKPEVDAPMIITAYSKKKVQKTDAQIPWEIVCAAIVDHIWTTGTIIGIFFGSVYVIKVLYHHQN